MLLQTYHPPRIPRAFALSSHMSAVNSTSETESAHSAPFQASFLSRFSTTLTPSAPAPLSGPRARSGQSRTVSPPSPDHLSTRVHKARRKKSYGRWGLMEPHQHRRACGPRPGSSPSRTPIVVRVFVVGLFSLIKASTVRGLFLMGGGTAAEGGSAEGGPRVGRFSLVGYARSPQKVGLFFFWPDRLHVPFSLSFLVWGETSERHTERFACLF